MKAAVVYFPQKNREKILNISKSIAKGFEKQGAQVDLIDASKDVNSKLTLYSYIAIGTDTASILNGRIDVKLSEYLSNSGRVEGKKAFAFVTSSLLGSQKTLTNLMRVMEKEGMFLKYSEILSDGNSAEDLASRLHIQQR